MAEIPNDTLHQHVYRALRESDPVSGSGLAPWQKPRYDKMAAAVVAELERLVRLEKAHG